MLQRDGWQARRRHRRWLLLALLTVLAAVLVLRAANPVGSLQEDLRVTNPNGLSLPELPNCKVAR